MKVIKSNSAQHLPMEWGSLTWYASMELGNSEDLTVGKCVIKPNRSNPRHFHPNCSEILHVLQGKISHSYNDETVVMEEGDTISVPANIPHHAANLGETDAILLISFSAADRKTVGE